jgi:hypothetical protein
MTDPATETSAPTLAQALLLLLGIAVSTVAYAALNAAVKSQELYIGFFFLFYWGGIQKADLKLLPSSAAGGFLGLSLGLLLQALEARLGPTTGAAIFVALIAVLLAIYLCQRLRFVINDAMLLLLTVATIAHVQAHADFRGLFASLAIAVGFFGALFWAVSVLSARRAAQGGVAAAPRRAGEVRR